MKARPLAQNLISSSARPRLRGGFADSPASGRRSGRRRRRTAAGQRRAQQQAQQRAQGQRRARRAQCRRRSRSWSSTARPRPLPRCLKHSAGSTCCAPIAANGALSHARPSGPHASQAYRLLYVCGCARGVERVRRTQQLGRPGKPTVRPKRTLRPQRGWAPR